MPRCFSAAGVGKITEDAVGRLLLATESLGPDEEAASFIADIDKCYENVDHGKLMRAGIQHGLPLIILRLCIDMYRVARAVAWNGVFASFV